MSQGRWYALTLQNSSTRPLQVGYSIDLRFNHQSLVSQGAHANGSNLAVVSNKNGTTTALHRILDPQSSWNGTDTKIWFATDQTVPALQTTSQQFYLVVGHPTLRARSNANQVFHRWANFKSTASLSSWQHSRSSKGVAGSNTSDNHVALYAEATSTPVYSDYSHTPLSLSEGFIFETRAQSRPASGAFADCNRSRTIAVRSGENGRLFASLRLSNQKYFFESYNSDQRGIQAVPVSENAVGDSTWHTYGVAWDRNEMHLTRDSVLLHRRTSGSPLPSPNQQTLRLGFRAIADGTKCSSPGQAQLYVDWARVRHYNHPGPKASLASTP